MNRIERGMILAAGLGLRMRPLTDDRPKALVALHGQTLLDRALDKLRAAGLSRIVVNAHYRAEMIRAHLAGAPDIEVSDERDGLLDTGGGVRKALPSFGASPFFVANCDSVWLDGAIPALRRLERNWRCDAMDALLMLHPVERAKGYAGPGDFALDPEGRVVRRPRGGTAPFVFTGVQILHPRLFAACPGGAFSLNLLYDEAAARGCLFGLVHDGAWFHVGTPADLAATEALLSEGAVAARRSPGIPTR